MPILELTEWHFHFYLKNIQVFLSHLSCLWKQLEEASSRLKQKKSDNQNTIKQGSKLILKAA